MSEILNLTNLIYYLIGVNLLTFILFGADKASARNKGWRISEKTLLTLALIGGSPAAIVAKKYFRHKTKKGSFKSKFFVVFILQLFLAAIGGFYFWAHA